MIENKMINNHEISWKGLKWIILWNKKGNEFFFNAEETDSRIRMIHDTEKENDICR